MLFKLFEVKAVRFKEVIMKWMHSLEVLKYVGVVMTCLVILWRYGGLKYVCTSLFQPSDVMLKGIAINFTECLKRYCFGFNYGILFFMFRLLICLDIWKFRISDIVILNFSVWDYCLVSHYI